MTEPFVRGGCQCGAVRYAVTAPALAVYHCHCSMCRKLHGAVFASFAITLRENIVIERGADNLAVFESSKGVERFFCRTCGCQLFCDLDVLPGERWYTPATLDGGAHPGHPPDSERRIFVDSKVLWHDIADDLPRDPELPPYGYLSD
jgi:hypothetical protein